jgi:ABC-type lipoprotein export system ATPase subunit
MTIIAELQHITKQYPLGQEPNGGIRSPVLNNLSLQIGTNESVAITGPSGSGKTTLLNIIGTLDRPTSGEVILLGENIGTMSNDRLAEVRNRKIGFVFQLHYLLPQFTLLENVILPAVPLKDRSLRKAAHQRALELLERVGLKDRIHDRPSNLSVGECQRAAVVRALINQPVLLLADEPTGSLDRENAEQLGQLLAGLKKEYGLSMIVVTHSADLARRMDRILSLSSGILYSGEMN